MAQKKTKTTRPVAKTKSTKSKTITSAVKKTSKPKKTTVNSEKSTQQERPSFELEIDRIFQKQKQNRWNIANTGADERIQKLIKLRKAIEARENEIKEAVFKDFHKSSHEAILTEILPVIMEIKDACKNLKKWMKPVSVFTPVTLLGSTSKLIYEPKGQVLILGPWNYPFHLIMAPLIAAIASGNVIMIRPSELTIHTSKLVKELIDSIFEENEVSVILGELPTSQYLLTKNFDHIFFTGSPNVGKIVMEAAAKNLTSVTLELGGKSPVIIDESANLDYTSTNVIWGKILNGGQTCVGVDYALVHESRVKEFIEKGVSKLKEFYGDDINSWRSNKDLCRVINDKNYNRIKDMVEEGLEKGGKVEIGGLFSDEEKYISPTLLTNVPMDVKIMQEEIFGPVLPIVTYKHIDDAIKIVQNKEKPLALYIFSDKEYVIKKILKNTSSGGVVVNGVLLHLLNPNIPFGGVNHSGLGSYHGHFGFKAFSHERAFLKINKLDMMVIRKLIPPYTNLTNKLADWIMKFF
ncbi:MAG: aldehyde dehydrogenase family protein [Leptospiraceae bacterium]|nr:aldehyde dehydrogenase family protein [Leptospiraceae bacterium]